MEPDYFYFGNALSYIIKMDNFSQKANKTEFWVLENDFCSFFIFEVELLFQSLDLYFIVPDLL